MATVSKKRTADDCSATSKKKKRKVVQKEDDKLKRFLDLVSDNDSMIAGRDYYKNVPNLYIIVLLCVGLTLFLNEVTHNGNEQLLLDYLHRHPNCSHLLAILQWEFKQQTPDTVRERERK